MTNVSSSAAAEERIGFGIGCAVVGMLGMSIMDTCAKLLGEGYAVSQVVLVRNGIGAVAVFAYVVLSGAGLASLRPRRPVLLTLRSLLNIAAAFLFFTGLRYMPLADAFAIAFAAPLFITSLSVPVLGEHVGVRRWAAVIVGFLGVVVVVQPGTSSFRIEALLPLGAALAYAVSMLLGRRLTRDLSTAAIMFWPSVGAVLVTAVMMPAQWQTPGLPDFGVFMLMGIIGTAGMSLITQGYRHAPAAVIAPFDYTVLVWGVIFGWVIWRDIPAPNVWAGAAILVASGLYILHRETRKPKPVQPPAGPLGPTA
ncbi:DMT family transporter [Pelagibius marinus]|uniref:DMT family transporter n=1 Tax=Pelagibius marinus TaxID=2762760 RepID=UPI0018733AD3|nr:DMT family transporter [Pelagibius marinus]